MKCINKNTSFNLSTGERTDQIVGDGQIVDVKAGSRPSAPAPSGEPLEDAAWWKAECLRVVALLRAKCSDDEWVRLGGMLPMRVAEAVESSPLDLKDAARLAQFFHETYERLAPDFGYETRKESAKPWNDVPEKNRNLMIAVCREALAAFAAAVREGR